MFKVFAGVWALLLGIVLIMLGNGMHFTLIGLRGGIEDFSSAETRHRTSGYFCRLSLRRTLHPDPDPARRACPGSSRLWEASCLRGLISFPLLTDPISWTLLRVLIGFCMSGILRCRRKLAQQRLHQRNPRIGASAYMIAQTLVNHRRAGALDAGDAGTSVLFIGASISPSRFPLRRSCFP